MFKEYFVILLLSHIIGDFYFQTEGMSDKKVKSGRWVLVHCFVYWVAVMLVSLIVISPQTLLYGTLASIVHMLIDVLKHYFIFNGRCKDKITFRKQQRIFCIDQILHIGSMIILAYFFVSHGGKINYIGCVGKFFYVIGVSPITVGAWLTMLLIIHKPVNVAISKVLAIYKPEDKDCGRKRVHNAGRFIGTIERIIMLILISVGQFSAIGLVLTAKSIARYDKIAKEPEFAEYYLLGTLLSTLCVVVVSIILL